MSAISIGGGSHGAAIARVAADWLGLAAAPAFATMALMTVCLGGGVEPLCSARTWLAHERNGPDVSAHERRFMSAPMAEADCWPEKLTHARPRPERRAAASKDVQIASEARATSFETRLRRAQAAVQPSGLTRR